MRPPAGAYDALSAGGPFEIIARVFGTLRPNNGIFIKSRFITVQAPSVRVGFSRPFCIFKSANSGIAASGVRGK